MFPPVSAALAAAAADSVAVLATRLGSGPRYMIHITLFCTLRESKNLLPCENRDTSGHCLVLADAANIPAVFAASAAADLAVAHAAAGPQL